MLSGNLHGGSVVASYPFDDSPSHEQQGHYSQTEDDGLFRYLALVYSRHHPVMRIGQPNCSDSMDETFKDGITNGARWYDVQGKVVYREHGLLPPSVAFRFVSLPLVLESQNIKFYLKKKQQQRLYFSFFKFFFWHSAVKASKAHKTVTPVSKTA